MRTERTALAVEEELAPVLKKRINWGILDKWADHMTPERARKAAVEACTRQNHAQSLTRRYAKRH